MPNTSFWVDGFLIASQLFIFLSSIWALINFISRTRSGLGRRALCKGFLFENEDGRATAESEQRFSNHLYRRLIIIISTACGGALSIACFVFADSTHTAQCHYSVHLSYQWPQFLIWLFLLLQSSCALVLEQDCVERFRACLKLSVSYILATFVTILQACEGNVKFYLNYLQLTRAFILATCFILCLTIPQHPAIYNNGRLVDGQWAVSLLDRISYSWVTSLLRLVAMQKRIELEDLPEMDHQTRAKALYDDFQRQKKSSGLAWCLIKSHTTAIIRIYILTVLASMLDFAPQLAMFQLLRALEARHSESSTDHTAIIWAASLGLIMLAKAVIDNWMWWLSHNHLRTPIRVQLSAILLAKAMRRKDVQAIQQRNRGDERTKGVHVLHEQEEDNQTRQGTINLVAVDSKRIAEFCIFQNQFLGVVGKIIVSGLFLTQLIGWEALLAGVLVQFLTIPLNVYFSKRYTNAQGDLMKIRDSKLSVLNEVLAGIRQIKFSALESSWFATIMEIREKELATQYIAFFAEALVVFCWLAGPVLLSAVSIAVYVLVRGELTASVAFTTISVLSTLQGTLAWIPELTTSAIQAWTSLRRIETYLNAPEMSNDTIVGETIAFQNATVSWPSDGEPSDHAFRLEEMNVTFPLQELCIVSGPTGSGKSLLLSAILGEADLLSGTIAVPVSGLDDNLCNKDAPFSPWLIPSAKMFVSQRPWVENKTFRDNILFGLPFNRDRYKAVLFACALEQDLTIMPDGELTEIGASGINLSGGQLWRLTLARAIYSRAGILIMDDIFSAVDAHVGRHILQHAICGELGQGRTRILVTHHVALFSDYHYFSIRLEKGRIVLSETIVPGRKGVLETNASCEESRADSRVHPLTSTGKYPDLQISVASEEGEPNKKGYIESCSVLSTENSASTPSIQTVPRVFVEEETKISGSIALSVYATYLRAAGWALFVAKITLAFGIYEAAILYSSWWISLWVGSYDMLHLSANFAVLYRFSHKVTSSTFSEQGSDSDLHYYLGIYLGISVVVVVLGALRYLLVFQGSIAASSKLFGDFTSALLHAPLRWLDTVPLGRILNRFTSDFGVIDSEMGPAIATTLNYSLRVIGIVVAGTLVSPYILVVAILFLAVSASCALYYLPGAREMKRMESISRSPVFETLGVLLAGVTTIRASAQVEDYIQNMFAMLDVHCRTLWYLWCFNTWLTFRLSVIGAGFTTTIALLLILYSNITAPLAGFVLIFTLDYSDAVMWVLRQYTDIELAMNAIERVLEYSEIEIENQGGSDISAAWPAEGALEVRDLVVGYAPDLPPILNGLTFSVLPNERVGVVGRTGAGKSSLALAIFRVLEPRQGSISIDGVDISKVKLRDLRSRLAIIPQNPVLFSGTIRSNIDPFSRHFDEEILEALQRVHFLETTGAGTSRTPASGVSSRLMYPDVKNSSPLDSPVGEGGYNLSQGQRQLLCLARAIISRPKILVLDEATSAVDKATDELIQRSIREEFVNCTLIVIAHRLSTVSDFDKILVLGEGRRLEFGKPQDLAEDKGVFAGMLAQSRETVGNSF